MHHHPPQVYILLYQMSNMVPHLGSRRPLFVEFRTEHDGTTVEFLATQVIKRVSDFHEFARTHGTSLAEVQLAYTAAATAASLAAQRKQQPWMVFSEKEPTVSQGRVYTVLTTPIGMAVSPTCEEVRMTIH